MFCVCLGAPHANSLLTNVLEVIYTRAPANVLKSYTHVPLRNLSPHYQNARLTRAVGTRAVVYLDADALVMHNMDEAFGCPGFCACVRHSERLNSGVMVLHPDAATFADMLAHNGDLPSYTGSPTFTHRS